MKMRELCDRTGFSKRSVHYYIKEGLLEPRQNPVNGYYEFSEEDFRRLGMIRSLRAAGFSISHIRSVLQTPATAVYYLNLRLKNIRSEIARLEKLETALSYMQHNLPIHPGFSDLERLIQNAGIPAETEDISSEDSLEDNDSELVNRYLWETFLPDAPLSEYQEYLWSKINRYMAGNYEADYHKISKALHGFSDSQIQQYFSDSRQVHNELILMKKEDYALYAQRMVKAIGFFLNNPESVRWWKSQYTLLLAPSTRVYDSEMAKTMEELSPLFSAYRTNVNAVCSMVYDWLHSSEGKPLLELMGRVLQDYVDIDGCSHGQLQGMASVFIHHLN